MEHRFWAATPSSWCLAGGGGGPGDREARSFGEVLIMKRRFLILTLSLLFLLPEAAFSAKKSVVIGFKQKPGPSEHALIHGARGIVKRTYELIPAMAASLPEEEIAKLRKNGKISYVEENAVYRAAAEPLPGSELENSWGVHHILADVAHASGNKGTGVRVAVLDTGIDYSHEDLDGNYRGGYDFVFDDDDPFDDSFNSHGTHVAGIVAAEGNGAGVVGVAPEADLYSVKVLDGAGFGTEDWIIAGIDWAVRNGIEIINLSLEGPDRQGLHDACEEAYNAGVLLVGAGGNSQAGEGPVEYPAAYDSVIAVTGSDALDVPGYFSPVGEEVELTAPGVDVLSTVAGGSYGYLSGTSQAAPHVTGVAALSILSNTEDLSGDGLVDNEDVRLTLQMDAIDLGAAGKDEVYGYGLVNGASASLSSEMVLVDIKPRSEANLINPKGNGVIPVAILGSDAFDVADVDVTTLAFGPSGAAPAFDLTHPLVYWLGHRDVNRDGNEDLLSYYRTQETGITIGDTEACLTGETVDSIPFEGCDAVTTTLVCGLGAELALLLPPLMWLWRRRRRLTV
jgi:subtilisin